MRSYVFRLIAQQIQRVTRYARRVEQVDPLAHDDGLLRSLLEESAVRTVASEDMRPGGPDDRTVFLLNGNLNYQLDAENLLRRMRPGVARGDRVVLVAYNSYLKWVYQLAGRLKLRRGGDPDAFLTRADIGNLAKLAGFEIVHSKAVGFFPFQLFGLGDLINRLLSETPVLRNLSLASVIWLKPSIRSREAYSLSIVVPARNESGNIEKLFEELPALNATDIEIVFVEGNSSDDTWEAVQAAARKHGDQYKIVTLQQPGKGKFDAVKHGFDHASMDLLTILDADLTMPPALLGRFLDAYCEGHADFINGNRLVYPREAYAMRFLNTLGNKFFAKFVAYLLGLKIGDSLCGTKLLHRADYERQCRWREDFGDFDPFGDFELLFSAAELKLSVVDVPVRYRARSYGETQIHRFRNGLELLRMCMIGLRRIKLR